MTTTLTKSTPTANKVGVAADKPRPIASPGSASNPDILLDAGTNELEVLVFSMGAGLFGVNVAKVREVIRPVEVVASPGQHPSIMGIFNMRGDVIPLVDLAKHLQIAKRWGGGKGSPEGRVIITEFNARRTGFMVDTVEQIHRISWSRVRPAPDVGSDPAMSNASLASATTGVIQMDERLILMTDFESIADAILLQEKLRIESVPNEKGVDRASKRVILVEDSPFMRNLMTKVLKQSGYVKLEVFSDGEAAWNTIRSGGATIDAVVSDIEMPRMDGLHLTRRIKETPETKNIPVVLFSSLVSDDNKKKGQQVGADVQIPKPELGQMVLLVDRVVSGERIGNAQANPQGTPS